MNKADLHFPERAPIDAYGNGGFRFAQASHRGSLLIVASGMYAWKPVEMDDISPSSFARAFEEADGLDFLLFGTGTMRIVPDKAVTKAFIKAGIGLEIMDTGAACRTYNVLLGEGRAVAAALFAVD